jgi:Holliday junction resolvase RusA-like endonuclease
VKAVVKGKVPSKSNQYKVVRRGSFCQFYKSKDVKDFEKSFADQISKLVSKLSIGDEKFAFVVDAYFANERADLDGVFKVTLDTLQDLGVIGNDKNCYHIQATKHIDKKDPRIEFEIILWRDSN